MEQLTDLKAILHSKRANIYYLEKCRVMQKDGRVLYLSEASKEHQYWNIPIANNDVFTAGYGYVDYPSGDADACSGGSPRGNFAVAVQRRC